MRSPATIQDVRDTRVPALQPEPFFLGNRRVSVMCPCSTRGFTVTRLPGGRTAGESVSRLRPVPGLPFPRSVPLLTRDLPTGPGPGSLRAYRLRDCRRAGSAAPFNAPLRVLAPSFRFRLGLPGTYRGLAQGVRNGRPIKRSGVMDRLYHRRKAIPAGLCHPDAVGAACSLSVPENG